MQYLDVGELAMPEAHFYDVDGEGAEPSAITLTVTKPDGTVLSFDKGDLTQGATTADWYMPIVVDVAGLWRFTYTGTMPTSEVTEDGSFYVGGDQRTGPCEPWCSWEHVTNCTSSTALDALDSAQREDAIDQASEILWNITGRVYSGICQTTRSLCLACSSCYPSICRCEPVNGFDLGIRAPVLGAWDVIVDGETLDASEYRVVNRRWLARTDGQAWPSGWNLLDDDPIRFRATWAYGRPIPRGGRRAAALFTAEIAKACAGQACQIPQRVTQITREGISYTVLDSMQMITEGRTGIALVDLWVAADKKGRRQGPRVFNAGAASGRMIRP